MSWMKWLPWRYVVGRVARAHGFLDPVALLARLHRFAQPSEVAEPVELLRAGVVFHARGLINSRVVQHNLDWVWPFWIERQFDPGDAAFIPRAFSITHINLTHRNWTAIGVPDVDQLPIVDPRGLLTPMLDGWSLDAWVVTDDGKRLFPSRSRGSHEQFLEWANDQFSVRTRHREDGISLETTASVIRENSGAAVCALELDAGAETDGWLVLGLRPCNPEGVSFIHSTALLPERRGWLVDKEHEVHFGDVPDQHHVSDYIQGDVQLRIGLPDYQTSDEGACEVGMMTAAALFRFSADENRRLTARIPLDRAAENSSSATVATGWEEALEGRCELVCPDRRYQFLYDAAVRTLVIHAPGEIYPGPYTYKRFWFRDAAFIIHGLLCAGLIERAEKALDRFPGQQSVTGYFHSQEGEWDSNGEVLWILRRFGEFTGRPPKPEWRSAIKRGADWIVRKRLDQGEGAPHDGLLPAGFSAEHLGPNDYYFWDDFWGVGGLESAAALLKPFDDEDASRFSNEAEAFRTAIDRSLADCRERLGRDAMPASPYRRLDAGAIGSLAAGYPLQLGEPDDPRLLDTVEFLLDRCFFEGAFFQDMIHSGLNAYLTLHIAQVLMRAGDRRCLDLIQTVANLASPTGQWPEAIHPKTGGGCMGDGHHVWAAAEWVLAIRNGFVREEGDRLILASGIPGDWMGVDRDAIRFGPAPTAFGPITVDISTRPDRGVKVAWRGDWHAAEPQIEVRLPGRGSVRPSERESFVELKPDCR